MANTNLLSVLMTSYNRESLVRDSIQSVLDSSFNDYEFIIVDDASTDNTWEIILDYAKKDKRIKPFKNECNLGDYHNRNKAASYATGKYIKYVDSDDLIFENTLSIIVELMEQNPDAAFGLSAEKKWIETNSISLLSPGELFSVFIFEGRLLGSSPTSAILRRDIFESVGGFSGKQYIGDMELWLRLSTKHSAVVFDNSLFFWREHINQQMSNENRIRKIRYDRFKLLQSYIINFEMPMHNYIKRVAIRNRRNIVTRNIIKDLFFFNCEYILLDIKGYQLNIFDFLCALFPNRYPIKNRILEIDY